MGLTYASASGDRRLQTIDNRTSGNALISASSYTYWNDGDVKDWTRTTTGTVTDYHEYDFAHQLLRVKTGVNGTVRFVFGYDLASNRTSEAVTTTTTTTTTWANNDVNQITTQTVAGTPTTFTYLYLTSRATAH